MFDYFKHLKTTIKRKEKPKLGGEAIKSTFFDNIEDIYGKRLKRFLEISPDNHFKIWQEYDDYVHGRLVDAVTIEPGAKITNKNECIYLLPNINSDFAISCAEILAYNFENVEIYDSYAIDPCRELFVCECHGNKHREDCNEFGKTVTNKENLKEIFDIIRHFYMYLLALCYSTAQPYSWKHSMVLEGYGNILRKC